MKGLRQEISDEQLNSVNGGVSIYSDNTLGFYGSSEHPYHFTNKAAVDLYITNHCRDKTWKNGVECDTYLITGMLDEGLIWTE